MLFQSVGLWLSPSNQELHNYIPISIFNQLEQLHSDQSGERLLDQSACESSSASGWASRGPGAETSVCISQLPSASESMLSFFTKDGRLFPRLELKDGTGRQRRLAGLWWITAGRAGLSVREGPGLRVASQPCCS